MTTRALGSLRSLIEQAGFRVKVFRSSIEFLDFYRPEETGCLVLDVPMPGIDGLKVQDILRARKICLPIIFISAYGDVPTCASAFRGGAVDFLEKPVDNTLLLDHIARLITQEEQRRGNNGVACLGDRLGLLTPTETEVLKALIEGKSIKDISRTRKVAPQTVWRHRASIFQKIGVQSQIELVRVATQWQMQQGQQALIADH